MRENQRTEVRHEQPERRIQRHPCDSGELDITGTTSKEAATTLSGSFASMKAASSDFLGNLALGKDIKPSLQALVETTSTYLFDNLLPAVGNIVSALPGPLSHCWRPGFRP